MKILDLIKAEFLKNYNIKRWLLIFLILLISIVCVTYFTETGIYYNTGYVKDKKEYVEGQYHLLTEVGKEDKKIEFEKYTCQRELELLQELEKVENSSKIEYGSWQAKVFDKIILLEKLDFWMERYLEDNTISMEWLKDSIHNYELVEYIEEFSLLPIEELEQVKIKLEKFREELKEVVLENKYYKYVELALESAKFNQDNELFQLNYQFNEDTMKMYFQNIIEKKIENENDYRVKNIYQRYDLGITSYNNDRVDKILDQKEEEIIKILEYSIEHDKKQDITYSNGGVSISADHYYISTKYCVNQILNLSIVVMVLVVLTSGDIVSKEHTKNTEKLLLASPNKRWKILLSKFIYIILHTYIIWLLGFILISIYGGIRFGFSDLLTAKLLYRGGSVVEVNYIFYMIKQIFYCSIPVISMISILFMLSTITLNTTITIGISTVLIMISPFLWHFIQQYGLTIVAYTPVPYFMFSQVLDLSENYLKVMALSNISEGYGIFISVVTIFVCYYVSNMVFIKRDIKN